jgi:hypothetical protein
MTLKQGGKPEQFTSVEVTEIEVHLYEICGDHSRDCGDLCLLDCKSTWSTDYVLDGSDIQGLL